MALVVGPEERSGVLHQLQHHTRSNSAAAQSYKLPQPSYNLRGTLNLLGCLRRRLRNPGAIGRLKLRGVLNKSDVVPDRSKGLVDFVGKRGSELAHAAKSKDAGKRLLVLAQLCFGPLLLRYERSNRKPGDGKDDHQGLIGG